MMKLFQNLKVKAVIAAWWSNQPSKKFKIHQTFFLLLCFFLPFQLNKFFWPEFSFINGLRIDYLAPSIYFTDILAILTIFFWVCSSKINLKSPVFIFIPLFLLLNILLANNPILAIIKSLKIVEFIIIGFYVSCEVDFQKVIKFMTGGVIIQLLLAIAQFLKGGSLGFWFIGERFFNLTQPGIALSNFFGHQFLRPYGTFGHPNALAGFLFIYLILFLSSKTSWILKLIIFFPSILVLVITTSRSVYLAMILIFSIFVFWNQIKRANKKIIIGLFLLVLIFGLTFPFLPIYFDKAFLERQTLALFAIKIWQSSPLVGAGANNFLKVLPNFISGQNIYLIQPVHNIFLLVLSEFGIIGFIFFIYFYLKTLIISQKNLAIILVLFAILITGLFDHYWITLQANSLLASIVFGLAWKTSTK